MTIIFTGEDPDGQKRIAQTERILDHVADELLSAIERLRAGELDAKATAGTAREMRAFLLAVLDERAKVAKLRKSDAAEGAGAALDLDAARIEIGRRLACLRDAGTG